MGSRRTGLARLVVGVAVVLKLWDLTPSIWYLSGQDVFRIPRSTWSLTPTPTPTLALLALGYASALGFAVGWRTRISGTVLVLVLGAILWMDIQLYSNHLFLLWNLCFLLTLANSGSAVSLDVWRSERRESISAWPVELLKVQLSIVYGFAALSKLNPTFLCGAILADSLRADGLLAFGESWRTTTIMAPMAFSAVLAESFVAVGLWSTRWRSAAVLLGVGLHLGTILLMNPRYELVVFALACWSIYPLFWDQPVIRSEPGGSGRE